VNSTKNNKLTEILHNGVR